jgi:deoxyadenosine/deoxycytidine kinase
MNRHHNNIRLVFLEGNIGAGKSTVLNLLSDRALVVPEAIPVWTGDAPVEKGPVAAGIPVNMLSRFYTDPTENAGKFQLLALITHMLGVEDALEEARRRREGTVVMIVERSVRSGAIFAEHWREHIDDATWYIYTVVANRFQKIVDRYDPQHIVLDVPWETSAKHLKHRNRNEEQNVESRYLRDLQEKHEEEFPRDTTQWVRMVENDPSKSAESVWDVITRGVY